MHGLGNSEQQREPLKAPVSSILSAVLLLVLFARLLLLATVRPQILDWMDLCSDLCNSHTFFGPLALTILNH